LLPWVLVVLAGGTDVTIVSSPGQVFAEVDGTRLEIPPETLRFSAESKVPSAEYPSPLSTQDFRLSTSVDPPDNSLYWQPAQPGPFAFLGNAGEWLQTLRPPARWVSLGSDFDKATSRYTTHYRLVDGLGTARITLNASTSSGSNGEYSLVVRPERRAIA